MTRIRPYSPADEPVVTELLVAAFLDDPGYRHTFPDARRDVLAFIMPRLLALRLGAGAVWVAEHDGTVVGSLSTSPSSTRFGVADYLRQGLMRMPLQFGWATTRRMLAVDGEIQQLRNAVSPREHHQYLAQIACHPDHQGKGVGKALVRHFLDTHARPMGQPATLMTTKSDNVLWYEQFGFAIAGQCGIQQSFTAWCMVRPAG